MSTPTPPEFDHDGAVITDAAGGAYPWIRTANGLWARPGLVRPRTWDQLLAWHQEAVDDPTDETTAMPTFVLLVPQRATSDSITEQAARLIDPVAFMSLDTDTSAVRARLEKRRDRARLAAADVLDLLAHQAPATERPRCASCGDQPEAHADPAKHAYACAYTPATENEAAEVEYGIRRDGAIWPVLSRERAEASRALHGGVYARTPAGPWREVSS